MVEDTTTAAAGASVTTFRRAFAAALRGVGISVIAAFLALLVAMVLESTPGVSRAVIFGATTALLTSLAGRRATVPGRDAAMMSLATLGWLPMLWFLMALFSEPIVSTHWRCGTGQVAALVIVPVGMVPLLMLSSAVATCARFPRLDALLRLASFATVGIVMAASALGLARLGRPDADSYVTSLPVTRTLAVGEALVLTDGRVLRYKSSPLSPPQSNGASGANSESCELEGLAGASFVAAGATLMDPPHLAACPPLTVRHDAKQDVWIVLSPSSRPFAWKGSDRESHDLTAHDVATSIAPPLGWTLGGLLGSLVGGALLLSAVREVRRARMLDAVEGVLQADGWVSVAGRAPMQIPITAGLVPGPILLRVRHGTAASYRDTGAGTVEAWRPGTLADARATLEARAIGLYASALTSSILCAAPLLLSGLGGSR